MSQRPIVLPVRPAYLLQDLSHMTWDEMMEAAEAYARAAVEADRAAGATTYAMAVHGNYETLLKQLAESVPKSDIQVTEEDVKNFDTIHNRVWNKFAKANPNAKPWAADEAATLAALESFARRLRGD